MRRRRVERGEWRPHRTDAELVGTLGGAVWHALNDWTRVRQVYVVPETWAHIEKRHGAHLDASSVRIMLPEVLADPRWVFVDHKPNSLVFVTEIDERYSILLPVKCMDTELWLQSAFVEVTVRVERRRGERMVYRRDNKRSW